MNKRIPDFLLNPKQNNQTSQTALQDVSGRVQDEFTSRVRQIASYVKGHPTTGIVAALCLGAFLGWVIKRR